MQGKQDNKFYSQRTQDQVNAFLVGDIEFRRINIARCKKDSGNFLAFSNQDYANFIKSKLESSETTIFDTNMYSPVSAEWFKFRENNDGLEEFIESIFNKSYDYQARFLEIFYSHPRIMVTEDVANELYHFRGYWQKFLDKQQGILKKQQLNLLKERSRAHVENMNKFHSLFYSEKRLLKFDGYMHDNYQFKAYLMEILNKANGKASLTDKHIIMMGINQTLKKHSASTMSRDKDFSDLGNILEKNISSLNSMLKKRKLILSNETHRNIIPTYIITAYLVKDHIHSH